MAAILRTVLTMTLLHYAASDDADHKTTTNPTDAAAMAASSCFKCPKDETGPDTCGSCTFTAGNFCNWTNSRHAEYLWKPDVSIQGRNKWIKVASDMTGNHKAVLTSPVMCHLRGDVICLMFRYSFTIWDKGMLTVQVCHTNCRDIFVAFTSSSGSRPTWHNQSVEFIAEGNLRVLFIGNKSEDGIGYEADAYLDYIVYRREPCYNSSNRVSTTTAAATDPTTVFEQKSHFIPSESRLELECLCPLLDNPPKDIEKDFLIRTQLSMKRKTTKAKESEEIFAKGGTLFGRKNSELIANEMTFKKATKGRMKLHIRLSNVTSADEGVYTCKVEGANDEIGQTKEYNMIFNFTLPVPPVLTTTTTPTTSTVGTTATTGSTTTTTIVALSTGNEGDASTRAGVYIALAISCFLVIVIVIIIIFFVRVRVIRRCQKAAENEKSLDGFEFGEPHTANYNLLHMPPASNDNARCNHDSQNHMVVTQQAMQGVEQVAGSRGTGNRNPLGRGPAEIGTESVPLLAVQGSHSAHDVAGLALSSARTLSGEAVAGSEDKLEQTSRQQRQFPLDTSRYRPRPSAAASARELSPTRRREAIPMTGGRYFSSGYARGPASRSYDPLDLTDQYDSEPSNRSRRYSVPDFDYDDYDDEYAADPAPYRPRRRHAEDGLPPRSLSQQSLHRLRQRGWPRRPRYGPAHAYGHTPAEQIQPSHLVDPSLRRPLPSTGPRHQASGHDEYRFERSLRGYADLPIEHGHQSPPFVLSPGHVRQGAQRSRGDEALLFQYQNHPSSPPPAVVMGPGHRNGQVSPLVVTVREDNNVAYSDSCHYNSARSGTASDDKCSSCFGSGREILNHRQCSCRDDDEFHGGAPVAAVEAAFTERAAQRDAARRRYGAVTSDTTMTSEDEMPRPRAGGPQYGNDVVGERFADQAPSPHHHQHHHHLHPQQLQQGRSSSSSKYSVTPANAPAAANHHHHRDNPRHAANSLPPLRARSVTPTRHYYNTSSAPRQRTRHGSRSAERRRPPAFEPPSTQAEEPRERHQGRGRTRGSDQPSSRGVTSADGEGGVVGNSDPRYLQGERSSNHHVLGAADRVNLLSGERGPGDAGSQFGTTTAPRLTPLNVPLLDLAHPGGAPVAARDGGESGGGRGGGVNLPRNNTSAAASPYSGQAAVAHNSQAGPAPVTGRLGEKEARPVDDGARPHRGGATNEAPTPPLPGNGADEDHRHRHSHYHHHDRRRHRQQQRDKPTATASDTSPDDSSRRRHPRRHGYRGEDPTASSNAPYTTSESDSDNSPTAFSKGGSRTRGRTSPGRHGLHHQHHRNHHHHKNNGSYHNSNFNDNQNRDDDHNHIHQQQQQRGASAHESPSGRDKHTDEISLRDIKPDNETRRKRPVSVNNNNNNAITEETRRKHPASVNNTTTNNSANNDLRGHAPDRLPVVCAADLDISTNKRRSGGGTALSRSGSGSGSGRCPAAYVISTSGGCGLQKKDSVTSRESRSRETNQRLEDRSRVEEPAVGRGEGGGGAGTGQWAEPPGSGRWAEDFGVEIQPQSSECSCYTEHGHSTAVKAPYRRHHEPK